MITVLSPYDGHEIGQVEEGSPAAVDAAVRAARASLQQAPLPPWRRAEILDRAAALLAERRDDFARTIAEEAAKPLKTARVEAERAVSTFRYAAVEARTLAGEMVPVEGTSVGEGKLAFTLRVPVGVVAAITPFNFPLNLVAHKLAPAIAAGCPVVLKPASQTPLSALKLAELLVEECGLPAARLHVVCGGGGTVGKALVEHEGVAYVSFTGSAEVGWGIRERAAKKRVGLELGNTSPVVIEADGDWQTAARRIAVAGFSHAGQSCISTQRVYVQRGVHDAFLDELCGAVGELVVGDPLDEATDVSSLISERDRDRVVAWIDEAVSAGATLCCGGDVEGPILRPTVLAGVTPDMRVVCEEVFGPVVAVAAYDRFEEGLSLANDTTYGLQAAVFTSDLRKALQAARTLDFGGVLVNEVPTWRTDQMPYGGVKDSGNTREGPKYAVEAMTQTRLVVVQP